MNIFDLQIQNRPILYCDRVSMWLISGGRVTYSDLLQALKGELFSSMASQQIGLKTSVSAVPTAGEEEEEDGSIFMTKMRRRAALVGDVDHNDCSF